MKHDLIRHVESGSVDTTADFDERTATFHCRICGVPVDPLDDE